MSSTIEEDKAYLKLSGFFWAVALVTIAVLWVFTDYMQYWFVQLCVVFACIICALWSILPYLSYRRHKDALS